MLKDKRATRLYCSAAIEKVMRFVATTNCINAGERLRFLRDVDDVFALPADVRFDVILMSPIDAAHGIPDADQVRAYRRLRTERLGPGGRMVPHRIEVWGQLVRSKWLRRMTRVVPSMGGEELERWGIADKMNRFATHQQLGLSFFEHDCVSGSFRVAELGWNDAVSEEERTFADAAAAAVTKEDEKPEDVAEESSGSDIDADGVQKERYVLVELNGEIPVTDLHGILCYYKVWLTPESTEPISTRRFASHVRRMCYVFDPDDGASEPEAENDDDASMVLINGKPHKEVKKTSRAVVHVRQHDGMIDCRLYKRGSGGQSKRVVNGELWRVDAKN